MGGATLVATCSARTGYFAGDYGMEPLWCSVTIGLRSYVDALGLTRHFCARHEEIVRGRWPKRYDSEIDGDGLSEAKRASEIARDDAYTDGRLTVEWHGHAVDVDLAP